MSCIAVDSALGRAIEGSAASVVPRKSFSYCKLPQQRQLLKLTVLKLDGTSFDVQVDKTASVGEIKQVWKMCLINLPRRTIPRFRGRWMTTLLAVDACRSHVWGHFCLCHEGYKLINDKEFLRELGVRDGDQLNFMRHLSLYHIPEDRPKKHTAAHRQRRSSAGFDEKRQNEDGEKYGNDENIIEQNGFNLSHFLRGWLSCWRLWFMGRIQSEGKGYFKRIASNSHLSDERQALRLPRFYGTP